jgi:hypothetical protein
VTRAAFASFPFVKSTRPDEGGVSWKTSIFWSVDPFDEREIGKFIAGDYFGCVSIGRRF